MMKCNRGNHQIKLNDIFDLPDAKHAMGIRNEMFGLLNE